MPTARPIIIEKFIDHTDSGVAIPSRCSSANPTAMPAMASRSGSSAAITEPNAKNSRIIVGMPLTSSALWSASSFTLLKSLHTGHSPVTSARDPARASTRSRSGPAPRPRRDGSRRT